MVNWLGACSGKLLHYIATLRCPLTQPPRGPGETHQRKTLGGNVVQIKSK